MNASGEPVAIVGGGAAGMATALALASRGIASRVFERSASANDIDRGDIIHPHSQALLRRWGAWPAVEDSGALRFSDFRIMDGDARPLLHANTRTLLGHDTELVALRHPDIVRTLRTAADRTGLIDIHDTEPVTELILGTGLGRVQGVRTAREEYPATLTVVAAGTRSKLRTAYFGAHRAIDYGTSFFNARLAALDRYRGCGYYVLDRAGILVMVALPNDELRIGIQFATRDRDDRPSVDTFAEHAGRILRPLRKEQLTVLEGHTYRLTGVLADTWWTPGAVLLGDVAHTVHPTGGQGMNLAFQDAETLATYLADPHLTTEAAARTYADIRVNEVRPVFRRCNLGGRMADLAHPAAIGARGALLRAVNHITPLKRATVRRLVEVR